MVGFLCPGAAGNCPVRMTVYAILPGRGYEEAALILGAHFAGILNRDGWAPYRQFAEPEH